MVASCHAPAIPAGERSQPWLLPGHATSIPAGPLLPVAAASSQDDKPGQPLGHRFAPPEKP